MEKSKVSNDKIKTQLYEKGQTITSLTERDSLNTDAIASLSDRVMKLMKEVEELKGARTNHSFTTT